MRRWLRSELEGWLAQAQTKAVSLACPSAADAASLRNALYRHRRRLKLDSIQISLVDSTLFLRKWDTTQLLEGDHE